MNVNTVVWLGITIAVGLILVASGAWLLTQFKGRSTLASKSVWLVASLISTLMLVSIGSKVLNLMSAVTLVDVAALSITGVLTGVFFSFWLMSGRVQGN
jgi:hypothetical protein